MARGEHRGFVPAAGSRSQDASLLLTPLPPRSFGAKRAQGHGWGTIVSPPPPLGRPEPARDELVPYPGH